MSDVVAPQPQLIERDAPLAMLQDALAQVARGSGSVALVMGDAGTGMSSLLRVLVDSRPAARVLLGACDDLDTLRTLGPIRDYALRSPQLREALRGAVDRDRVMSALQNELAEGPHPTLAIMEDLHWADDATIDVLTFLSRRIEFVPVLLVLSMRETEIQEASRLQRFLASLLDTGSVIRLRLGPLSQDAVTAMCTAAGLSNTELYRQTGGNPFFVTELLAAQTEGVPVTVQHAVLGRVARLPSDPRHAS